MDGWDWESIDVVSGEWWLLLIGLALFAAGLGIGYLIKDQRRKYYRDIPPV